MSTTNAADLNIFTAIWSLNTFAAYMQYNWGPYRTNGQLPANDWNCAFGMGSYSNFFTWWFNCTLGSWVWPLILSMWFFVSALFVQATQHWGFFAGIGTPSIENSFVTGVHNVYTAWYVLDAEISTFYTFWEVFWNSFWIFFMAGHIMGYNLSFANMYLYYSWLLFFIIFIYQANMTYIFCYNVINAVYL